MYVKLTKKFITQNILIYLPQSKLGRKPKIPLWRIVKMIIYKLKTGCQWREIPVKAFCRDKLISWNTVFYHFNKWSKSESWAGVWSKILELHKGKLDMSSVALDGSQTPVKREGEGVAYQGRKKAKTTNAIFLTDKQGIPLAMSEPVSGNHHDLYEIKKCMTKIIKDLGKSNISVEGLFMNADAGFDAQSFRDFCEEKGINCNISINKRNSKHDDYEHFVDEELYKERFSIERTNAWIDAFKCLLVRFETTIRNWCSFHYLAFSLIFLRKVKL